MPSPEMSEADGLMATDGERATLQVDAPEASSSTGETSGLRSLLHGGSPEYARLDTSEDDFVIDNEEDFIPESKEPPVIIPTRSLTRPKPRFDLLRVGLAFGLSAIITATILLWSPVGSAVSPLVGGHLTTCPARPTINWTQIDTCAV